MASPFANAGFEQFGQNSPSVSGSGGGGFLAGLAVKKSGLEDYLNKNFGATYEGGKLAPWKPPANNNPAANASSAVSTDANAVNTVPANSAPPVISQPSDAPANPNLGFLDNSLDAINKTGATILNGGKSIATSLLGT